MFHGGLQWCEFSRDWLLRKSGRDPGCTEIGRITIQNFGAQKLAHSQRKGFEVEICPATTLGECWVEESRREQWEAFWL
jgi:hypothetical protein